MDKKSKKARQRVWLGAFKANLFNVTEACNKIGIDRSTYYRWLENDPDFAQAVQDAREEKIDFIENQLLERIAEGDTVATIFALKSLAKHRGYVERQEVIPVNTLPPSVDIKILLANPEIRAAIETISNQVGDGQRAAENIKRIE